MRFLNVHSQELPNVFNKTNAHYNIKIMFDWPTP